MERSSTRKFDPLAPDCDLPDDVSVRRWFGFYALLFAAGAVPLAVLISRQPWAWREWADHAAELFRQTSPAIKLLGFAIYTSLCCTFLPLPTGWIVAGVATREAAVAAGASGSDVVVALLTTLIVAVVGAVASTIANLNDYHLFTWMLRHHRIARVRRTSAYLAAARWFAGSPFFLLVVFNIAPIPVDVVRILATTHRYPRAPFAAANFLGRFVRYAAIAFVTYWFDLGWLASAVLLALAAVLGGGRIIIALARRISPGRTNVQAPALSISQENQTE